jgi:DNA-binding CsgD family transcriptional regulator
VLLGREQELRHVAALLEEARRGRSGTLTIVGEPGVGKTALLEEARLLAHDMQVLSCTGVESESELAFASLHELLRPLLGLLPRIPASQAKALGAALALSEGEADTLAVGAGTLSLLVEAADQVPTLVLLDDAHWLDRASADALVFAARRLRVESLAALAATRPGQAPAFEPLPRLEVGPLAHEHARRLLRERPHPVAPSDEARVLAAAAGNPLALLELPVELAGELPSVTTPHERLERAFSRRVEALSAGGRRGLLLAAAEPDPGAVHGAASALALQDPLGAAEAAGLVHLANGSIEFRHPVVRSLVYARAPAAERAAAHRALAGALRHEGDRDRRAWHLAAATQGEDEEVATLLEHTAERAIARGGHAAGARALERAARLSPDRAERARRLYAASRSEYWGGDATKAGALAKEGLPLADDPRLRAELVHQVHAVADFSTGGLPEAVFLQELERAEGLDDEHRARLLMSVVNKRMDALDAAGAVAVAAELARCARGAGPWWSPRALATAASAHLLAGERRQAVELSRELCANPAIPAGFAFDYMSLEWFDELRASLAETLREGRANGNLLRIVWNQSCLAHLELRHGRLSASAVAAAEAIPLAEVLGVLPMAGATSVALAAVQVWRGEGDAGRNARLAAAAVRADGDPFQEGLAQGALALLALGAGRPADAIVALEPPTQRWGESTVADPAAVPFVPDLVEAYLLDGETGKARELLDRFAPLAEAAGNTWMLAACARCKGLLAPADAFDAVFSRGLGLLEPSPYRLDLARMRLAYGERLRRAGRRRDARVQLQAAHDAFAAVAAVPWQNRAAAELRATGVHVDAPAASRPELTPQELHIAGLVAEGKSNKEIGAAIYLSPKTVAYHLANVYRKLDIHSRAELARLVARDAAANDSHAESRGPEAVG